MTISSERVEAVALQLSIQESYQKNFDNLVAQLERYKNKRLIVAPEVCLSGFDYTRMKEAALFSQEALRLLCESIDDQIVVLTLLLAEADGFVNMAVVIHRHQIVHQQRKTKLFKLGEEDRYFVSGDTSEIVMFEIDKIKYAILICFELRFKSLWQQIEGADVVIVPARWGLARKSHLEILSRALAIMNQCYVVVSNSADVDMARSSAIVAPDGEVNMDDNAEAIIGEIDMKNIKRMRRYIVMD